MTSSPCPARLGRPAAIARAVCLSAGPTLLEREPERRTREANAMGPSASARSDDEEHPARVALAAEPPPFACRAGAPTRLPGLAHCARTERSRRRRAHRGRWRLLDLADWPLFSRRRLRSWIGGQPICARRARRTFPHPEVDQVHNSALLVQITHGVSDDVSLNEGARSCNRRSGRLQQVGTRGKKADKEDVNVVGRDPAECSVFAP